MLAVTMSGPGGPEVLSVKEVPDPIAGPGEVVIAVAAAGVNRADLMQRQGYYPPPPGASDVIGLECSGVVAEIGPDVVGLSIGDEVCALLAGGGYASRVSVPAAQVMPIPAGVDLVTAAGIAEVACTVWSNVADLSRLVAGEYFLVHGGSSGIGTWAIQYARSIGAGVITTAGSADKLAVCRELGAELAINYKTESFAEVIQEHTSGHGVDVILDTIGGKYLEPNLASLALGGRVTTIGLLGGASGELKLGLLLMKQGTWRATSLRSRPTTDKGRICAGVIADMWPLVADGSIRPIIDRVLPMSSVGQAHQLIADSTHIGKVLLSIN